MTTLFDFGLERPEPHIWDVVPDIELDASYDIGGHPSSPRAYVWVYGTCWISNKLEWWKTPRHFVFEEDDYEPLT